MEHRLNTFKQIRLWILSLLALALIMGGVSVSVATAQAPDGYWWEERSIETADVGAAHPVGRGVSFH